RPELEPRWRRSLTANGHAIAIVARREAQLRALADEIAAQGNGRPEALAVDLGERDGPTRLAHELKARGLDVATIVNNAGFGLGGEAATLDREEQLAMIDPNVRTVTDLSRRLIASLQGHRGGILNVASIAVFMPGPGMAVYDATKAYGQSFSEAL